MLLSYNLIKKLVSLPEEMTVKEVAERLTLSTVEVEQIIDKAKELDNIFVGRVVRIEKHPGADKLKLAFVDLGEDIRKLRNKEKKEELAKIVCGGVNLQEGMMTVVALPGALVRWHGQGDLVKLEKATIRGEESEGMICAGNEIGLSSFFPAGELEVIDLQKFGESLKFKVGESVVSSLGLDSVIFEIDNKSLTNRPDLWSHYGISREVAAIFNGKLNELEVAQKVTLARQSEVKQKDKESKGFQIEIKDNDLCPRYLGLVIDNIIIKESPEWLKKELACLGLRAINNIVDITNYVMAEVGEPLHAFDKTRMNTDGNIDKALINTDKTRIIIRRAAKGEKILLLDEQTVELDEEMLIIANDKKPIALAGIMGGKESGVGADTKAIVLEAANFNGLSIRKTAQKLGLRTEASIRFEKWLDPNLAELGMRRAIKLIKEILPEAQISNIISEAGEWQQGHLAIPVTAKFIQKRIGEKIKSEEILAILTRLGFAVEDSGNSFVINVPSWRATGDIRIPEDIVEEVARIYGYDKLSLKEELVEMRPPKYQREFEVEKRIKNYLIMSAEMHEVFNYPWAEARILKALGWQGRPEKEMIAMVNPPSEGNKYLVTSLMPNVLKNIEDNLRFFDEFKIFELARVFYNNKRKKFYGDDKLPEQPKMLAGAVVNKDENVLLKAKGILWGACELLGVEINFDNKNKLGKLDFLAKDKVLSLMNNGEEIGWVGLTDGKKLNFRNKQAAVFEINWDKLMTLPSAVKKYEPLPVYPAVERDIAVEVQRGIKWAEIIKAVEKIKEEGEIIIKQVIFLSEYPLAGKKSVAFRIVCQGDKTLTTEEIEALVGRIVGWLKEKVGAELRK